MGSATSISVSEERVRQHFDSSAHLYVNKELAVYAESVRQRLQMLSDLAGIDKESPLNVLDIGCGGGMFLDMLLSEFPNATATGVDLSTAMLQRNTHSERKKTLVGDALNLQPGLGEFNVICVDTLMHHLISTHSYSGTIRRIQGFLSSLHSFLQPGGAVLVREIYHEYMGVESFGSRAIYSLSTARVSPAVESWLRRVGIQTANVGVCFLTRSQWAENFAAAGFQMEAEEVHKWPGQPYRKFGFAESGDVHYLLRRPRPVV